MAPGKDRQVATVSQFRPRAATSIRHRRISVAQIGGSNVIDLGRARARRRTSGVNSPPEGTAA